MGLFVAQSSSCARSDLRAAHIAMGRMLTRRGALQDGGVRFGVEVEFDGMSISESQRVAERYFDGGVDSLGRRWKICADSSVPSGFELVTPPIRSSDVPTLLRLVDELTRKGARPSHCAGIHVHLGAERFTPMNLVSLVNIYASYAEVLDRMLDVHPYRRLLYCKGIFDLAERLARTPVRDYDDVEAAWFGPKGKPARITRYHRSRYAELNINSYFYRRTIEFRVFNSTARIDRLATYIDIVLAMGRCALAANEVIPYRPVPARTLSESLRGAALFFNVLGLDGPNHRAARADLCYGIERYYGRGSHTSRRPVHFETNGAGIFAGESASGVVRRMVEQRYFEGERLEPLLQAIRRGIDDADVEHDLPSGDAVAALRVSRSTPETFSRELLLALERCGEGRLFGTAVVGRIVTTQNM